MPILIVRNIIKFFFTANWKWNNNYSNSNIQYNTNVSNILNKEMKKKTKNVSTYWIALMKTGMPSQNRCISFVLHRI